MKLTTKEEEVMTFIWKLGSCTPKDVQALYGESRPHINTIATMFQKLERKGFLKHEPKGRGYIYHPIMRKEDYGCFEVEAFVEKYFKKSYMNLVETFVQTEKISKQDLLDFLTELKTGKSVW